MGAGVERGAIGVFGIDEIGRGVVLGAAEVLELDVGRIADDAVEATVGEDFGESGVPVEGVDALAFVGIGGGEEGFVAGVVEGVEVRADEAVAAADVVIERAERLAGCSGVEPECELGDFHGLLVDVHAVDVVGEDGADDAVLIEQSDLTTDAFLFGDDPAGFFDKAIKRLDEKCTGAAGGIDDSDLTEVEKILVEKLHPCSANGSSYSTDTFSSFDIERQYELSILINVVLIENGQSIEAEFGFDVLQACADGLLDDGADGPLGGVIDAVGFALAEFVDGDAAVGFGLHDFQLGDGLLEDAAERVKRDGAFASGGAEAEVVGGGEVEEGALVGEQAGGLVVGAEDLGGDVEGVEFRVLLE